MKTNGKPRRFHYTFAVRRVWRDASGLEARLPRELVTALGRSAPRALTAIQIRNANRGFGVVNGGLVAVSPL